MTPRKPTDLGNAERLVDQHGSDIRYAPALARWYVWDGKRWVADELHRVREKAKHTVRSIVDEANAEEGDRRKDLLSHAIRSESDARVRAMIELAAGTMPEIKVTPADLDADPYLLNLQNGTLNLRSQQLQPHRREDLLTRLSPATYDPSASCPRWLEFLGTIMLGRQDLVDYLQEAFAYSLTADVGEQCLFLLHGGGQNGKSTVLDVLRAIAGDYAAAAGFDLLLEQRNAGPRNDIVKLMGARLVTANEAGAGQRLAETVVKQLTGGDKISARLLYSEPIEFTPTFKFWLGANHKPVIRGTDLGIWRRIRLIPFDYRIPDEARVPNFAATFADEWPGILSWAVAGAERWIERGRLLAPEAVMAATAEYRSESDVVGRFIEERCESGRGLTETHAALYASYRHWCEAVGERGVMSGKAFAQNLDERGVGRVVSNNHSPLRRTGLRLLTASHSESGGDGGRFEPSGDIRIARAREEVLGNAPHRPHRSPSGPEQLDIEPEEAA